METNQFRTKTADEISDFLHNLFFLEVSLRRGGVFKINEVSSFVVSVYRNTNDAIIGALLLEISAAACLAGAMCDLNQDAIEKIANTGQFTEDVWTDLQEVFGICSQLFAKNEDETIYLEETYIYPSSLPEEAFEVLAADFDPLLFRLSIDGYGGGVIAVLDGENNSVFADEAGTVDHSSNDESETTGDFYDPFVEEYEEEEDQEEQIVPKITSTPFIKSSPAALKPVALGIGIGIIIGALSVGILLTPEPEVIYVPTPVRAPPEKVENVQVEAPAIPVNVEPINIEQEFIPNGTFEMGCSTEYSVECLADEFPSHTVRLSNDFYIMKHEVTQELFQRITNATPSRLAKCSDCPVENVSWYQAVKFANQLSIRIGYEPCYQINGLSVKWEKGFECLGFRLPTEAEWEYAARGSKGLSKGKAAKDWRKDPRDRTNLDVQVYSGNNTPSSVAWYGGFDSFKEDNLGRLVGIGDGATHSVCSKDTNEYNLCDMSGNVWEWVWDGFDDYSTRKQTQVNPVNSVSSLKVLRGGGWLSSVNEIRTSYRLYANPSVIDSMVPNYGSFGFRLVRTSPDIKGIQ